MIAAKWYRSIDLLRRLSATAMVPAHGVPVLGAAEVEEVLRNYRDAIQFVHDQTVRQMNKGIVPDELARVVRLPPHLAAYKPWMQEFFGTVSQLGACRLPGLSRLVRGRSGGAGPRRAGRARAPRGGADGRPRARAGRRRQGLCRRRLAVGGRTRHPAWCASTSRTPPPARSRRPPSAGSATPRSTPSGEAGICQGARELEGFDLAAFRRAAARGGLGAPDLLTALPARAFVDGLMTRLKAEDTFDVTMTVGFRFSDIGEAYAVRLPPRRRRSRGSPARQDRPHAPPSTRRR